MIMEKIECKKEYLANLMLKQNSINKSISKNSLIYDVRHLFQTAIFLICAYLGTKYGLSQSLKNQLYDEVSKGVASTIQNNYNGLKIEVGSSATGYDFQEHLASLYQHVENSFNYQILSPEQFDSYSRFLDAYPVYKEYIAQVFQNIDFYAVSDNINTMANGAMGAVFVLCLMLIINDKLNQHRQKEELNRVNKKIKNLNLEISQLENGEVSLSK